MRLDLGSSLGPFSIAVTTAKARWVMNWQRTSCVVALGALLAGGTSVSAQDAGGRQVDTALQQIGAFVERYYSRALSVVADDRVRIQPLGRDLSAQYRARHLLYEMRVEWEAGSDDAVPEPIIVRELLEADGRPLESDDDLECTDPRLESAEPLAIFLPERRHDFSFSWAGRDHEGGRDVIVLDYRTRSDEAPTIEWDGPCVSIDLPGMRRGTVWADAESGDVVRLDEHLTGRFEFRVPPEQNRMGGPLRMTLERADSSIRYRPVGFSDPDETLLLPASIELMTVWRNGASPRLLITHDISNYRRFVTSFRILSNPRLP